MKEFQVTIKTEADKVVVRVKAESRVEAINQVIDDMNINLNNLDDYDFSVVKADEMLNIPEKVEETYYCRFCNGATSKARKVKNLTCSICGRRQAIEDYSIEPIVIDKAVDFASWSKEDLIDFILDVEGWEDDDEKSVRMANKNTEELIEICKNL